MVSDELVTLDPADRTLVPPGLHLNYFVFSVLRIFEAIMAKRLIQSYCFHNGPVISP